MSDRIKSILIALAGVLIGTAATFGLTGNAPDAADVSCEAAEAIVASEACTEEETEGDAEEATEETD